MKHLISTVAFTCLATGAQGALATVGFANITPNTSMPAVGGFPLSEIVDGITNSNTNGFVSNSVGVITFTFDQDYHLESFLLWNDVDVRNEGIDDFSLTFLDSSDSVILVPFSTDFVGPVGQTAPEEYVFDSVVLDVKKVELEVLTTQFNFAPGSPRTEIREVDFGVAVPEPSSALLLGLGAGIIAIRRRRSAS